MPTNLSFLLRAAALGALLPLSTVQAAGTSVLTAGDLAIIGRINNTSPDSFAFVALVDIAAGTTVYFTDNGWTGSGFRGATATDGDGNENLTRWVAAGDVLAGTIIPSTAASFTTSGAISGATSGAYASLAFGQGGDQVMAFQNSNASNPLFNTATQTAIYQLDDTNGFENATDSSSGAVLPGLAAGSTALSLNFAVGGAIAVLPAILAGGPQTRDQWLATFADPANWTGAAGALPTGTIQVTAVPEPQSAALLMAGLAALGFMAGRRQAR